jgi:AcrR family transcriptional regulator
MRNVSKSQAVRRVERGVAHKRPRTRLTPMQRSDQILRGAILFFAERGFSGQTRELAQQLGISQGLLYRYFPTKEMLIERIYEELFVSRMKPEWDVGLSDRSTPLLSRLTRFYLDYATMLHDDEWGRIYLYSGLGGSDIARRFASHVTQNIFTRVIEELRREFRLPGLMAKPMTEPESELMWALHGSIFYIGIRKWVYRLDPPNDVEGAVRRIVAHFYGNARELMLAKKTSRKRTQ